ncbi:MAG: hypothetical protein R3F54_06230 [Alphaproteobacteria bacterium]
MLEGVLIVWILGDVPGRPERDGTLARPVIEAGEPTRRGVLPDQVLHSMNAGSSGTEIASSSAAGPFMRINIPPSAAESGTMRVWLRKVPDASNVVHAFRVDRDGTATKEVARAYIYGRGAGSTASERVMLLFRFQPEPGRAPPRAGEELELRAAAPDGRGFVPIELDIIGVQ